MALDVRGDEPGLRSESVRRANLSTIVRELHDAGSLSRSELGVRTGLTRSSIRTLVGELALAGLVAEVGTTAIGTPGRPSVVVQPNARRPIALALEISVDSIAGAVVGFGGEVHQLRRTERPRGELSLAQTVDALGGLARQLDAFHSHRDDAVGIAVGVAGIVRRSDGLVRLAPNLGWHDLALGQALRQSLGTFVPITVANEADLGALAEARRGSARGFGNVIFISGEVGVGGGLIVDGRPLAGAAGYGGEIGHMPVNPSGRHCHCGSTGCWETEIGEDALLVHADHPSGGGRDEVEAVLREARDGAPLALAALEHIGRWLGYGLAGLVNLLNPERIVLGGRFGRLYPFVADEVERQLDRYALAASRRLVTVVPTALGEEAPLLGAAELALEPFLADPAAFMRSPLSDTAAVVSA